MAWYLFSTSLTLIAALGMSVLATRKFTVEAANELEPVSRASRRVIINANVLKQANLYAGDPVAIKSGVSNVS